MKKDKKVFMQLLIALFLPIFLTGCFSGDEDESTPMAVISGSFGSTTGSQKVASQSVGTLAVTDYVVYCVTFTQIPIGGTSTIGADGSFALQMPFNTPFGCFVNNAATNQPVASMLVEGTSSGFGGDTTNTLNLNNHVDFGSLTIDLDEGKVVVPKARVEASTEPVASGFSPTLLSDKSYTMSCVLTGNTVSDQTCSTFLADNNNQSVYMRLMTASKGSETVYGLGVWRSATDFTNCGSIDMLTSEQSGIESGDGISFTSVAAGSAFTNNQTTCPTRDGNAPTSMDDPENYYAAGPLVPSGNGYTLRVENDFTSGSNCTGHEQTIVTFETVDGVNLIGSFQTARHYEEAVAGACSGNSDEHSHFVVNFTQQ